MEKKSNAHITPIRPPPGDSAHSGVINTAVPRGGNGSHSRGRGGTVRKDTSPIKQETGGVHKGHFHIPAGMVVRGGGCSPYAPPLVHALPATGAVTSSCKSQAGRKCSECERLSFTSNHIQNEFQRWHSWPSAEYPRFHDDAAFSLVRESLTQ